MGRPMILTCKRAMVAIEDEGEKEEMERNEEAE